MYVSTSGEYWRSDCISTCSCATILSNTWPSVVACCAAAASGNAPSAKALVKMFRVRIMASKPVGDRNNPLGRLASRGQTAICTEDQFRNSVLVVWRPGRNGYGLMGKLEQSKLRSLAVTDQ